MGDLYIPVQLEEKPVELKVRRNGKLIKRFFVSLAGNRVDYWEPVHVEETGELSVETEAEGRWISAVQLRDERLPWEKQRQMPLYHCFLTGGGAGRLLSLQKNAEGWLIAYRYNPWGVSGGFPETGLAVGRGLLSLRRKTAPLDTEKTMWQTEEILPEADHGEGILLGDIAEQKTFVQGSRRIILGISRRIDESQFCGHVLTLPAFMDRDNRLSPCGETERLRVWTRKWENERIEKQYTQLLRFRIAPGVWPNIRILPPEGKPDDISAEAFEAKLELGCCTARRVELEICGIQISWDRNGGTLEAGGYRIETAPGDGLSLHVFSDRCCGEIFCQNRQIFLIKTAADRQQQVDNGISGNLEGCCLKEKKNPRIRIRTFGGACRLRCLEVFGLRSAGYSAEGEELLREKTTEAPVFYQDRHYTVWNNRVRDERCGEPDAWALDSRTVLSPVRVTEEFVWRDTPWGDMVRAAERTELWKCQPFAWAYPEMNSGIAVVDAAYHIALDVFEQCKSRRCAQEGQEGMWAAGMFQGEGGGFGVWLRDSAHIALRSGSLIDPAGAASTLRYTAGQGFDNGSDGPAMAIVGIWDYYLVTGDQSIIFETWPKLLEHIQKADERFCEEKGLVRAEQSTSNDAFSEPENGGFCLGTECYFMKAYADMAEMGSMAGHDPEEVSRWRQRAEKMKEAIRTQYWNEEKGYYTSGPQGSEAYRRGCWETSGEEGALWSRFEIADRKQKERILEALEREIMTEYGIPVFPHRKEKNHFCGSIWVVWEAGIASAASECGKSKLLLRLIAQQVRNCIINKTFYEVIDADTGQAWRWPGQLWHAAGFLSFFYYGLLGIRYEKEGMYFCPCVPRELAGLRFSDLCYRNARLDIEVQGFGRLARMLVNGKERSYLPADTAGKCEIVLEMENKQENSIEIYGKGCQ